VRVKGYHSWRKRSLPRFIAQPPQQRLVAQVHTIENTDGEGCLRAGSTGRELRSGKRR
jgi:hypothetical protein